MIPTNVSAVVKWFNPVKGFGFVAPTDGSPDAFLHISVVQQFGRKSVPEGATIVCDLTDGRRGPQVERIHSIEGGVVDEIGEAGGYRGGGGGGGGMPMTGPSVVDGVVKFFNTVKGFGFVVPDDGSKDVFVHIRALEVSGLTLLEPEQRVRVHVRMGQKGPMAERVELL